MGLDSSLVFFQNVYMDGYAARTQTAGGRGDDASYRAQFSYTPDRYGVAVERLVVEKNFNPEIGFLRRNNFRRNFAQGRFSPRTMNNRLIRRFNYQASLEYTTDNNNRPETREAQGLFRLDFHSGDLLSVQHSRLYGFVPSPFLIATGVSIPVGGYEFEDTILGLTAGQQHRISGVSSSRSALSITGTKEPRCSVGARRLRRSSASSRPCR